MIIDCSKYNISTIQITFDRDLNLYKLYFDSKQGSMTFLLCDYGCSCPLTFIKVGQSNE